MRSSRCAIVAASLVVALGAQAAASATPAGLADAYGSLAALYLKLGAVIVGDKAKCAHMASDVAAWTKTHPRLKALSAATAALPARQHGQDEAKYNVALHAAQTKMLAAQKACGKTGAFGATYALFRPLFYPRIVVLP